jgi:hypothetical protein
MPVLVGFSDVSVTTNLGVRSSNLFGRANMSRLISALHADDFEVPGDCGAMSALCQAEGCRHFFHNGGLGWFEWALPLVALILVASTALWRSRQFLFWHSRSGSTPLPYVAEIGYSLDMPEPSRFDCPNCRAEYKLVLAEADPPPDPQIVCRRCGAPLRGREGRFILKYFLVDRPRTAA